MLELLIHNSLNAIYIYNIYNNQNQVMNIFIIVKILLQMYLLTFTPSLVLQEIFSLLANTEAVRVDPLLPPHPTSMQPTRGIFALVLKVSTVVIGVTISRPLASFFTWLVS